MKKLLLSLSALLLLAALVFTGIYFTRFQSMAALQKITDYSDGYNLYRMECYIGNHFPANEGNGETVVFSSGNIFEEINNG